MKQKMKRARVLSALDPHNPVTPPTIGITEIELNGYSVDVRALALGTFRPALILPNKQYFSGDFIVLTIVSSRTSSELEYDLLGWIDRAGFDTLTAALAEDEEVYIPAGLLYPMAGLKTAVERSVRQVWPQNGETL